VQLLVRAGIEVHLVVTPLGQRLLHDELGMEGVDLAVFAGSDAPGSDEMASDESTSHAATQKHPANLILHNYRDVGASIASGSFQHDGMLVLPCSSNSLSAIANGSAQNLLHRAAHVTLKERRKLVLLHREMPLSLIDIRNMAQATEAGAIICPASPGFYMLPQSVENIIDFVVGRVLDLIDVPHDLAIRWGESTIESQIESPDAAPRTIPTTQNKNSH
jgi:4-hydroxy-3-polyprenylbenzoate decarboxylase